MRNMKVIVLQSMMTGKILYPPEAEVQNATQ
jgi:hypothetical protein